MPVTPIIHIGQEIEARINQLNISASEFARRIDTSKQNVNRILKKESIDTAILQRYCEVLDYNFFALYCPALYTQLTQTGDHSVMAEQIGTVDQRKQEGDGNQWNEPGAHGNVYNGSAPLLQERIKHLEDKLKDRDDRLREKDERIAELKERIAELKAR